MIKIELNGEKGYFITEQQKQDLEETILFLQSKSKNVEVVK